MSRATVAGFTLIELMVTVAIVAILAMFAAPNMQSFFTRNRLATQSNSMISAFSLARSEAIKRGVRVTVCPTDDPNSATANCAPSTNWATGWLVFSDRITDAGNSAGTVDGADERIRIFPALQSSTLTAPDVVAGGITYRGDGIAAGISSAGTIGLPNSTLTMCTNGSGRDIVVNGTGRVSVRETQGDSC